MAQQYNIITPPQIEIQDSTGTEIETANKNDPYQVRDCNIVNSDSSYDQNEKFADPFQHTIPDIEVTDLTSATSLGTFPAGVDISVNCPAGGGGCTDIIPVFVRPRRATNSYVAGDLFDQWDRGDFARLDTERSGIVSMLGADNYTLHADTLNPWGTTDRFVFEDGSSAWNGTSFETTYPVNDYVIIDTHHYLIMYVANLMTANTWQNGMAACEALAVGGYGWRAYSPEEILAILPNPESQYYSTGNPFRRGVVTGLNDTSFWTSATAETSASTNAFILTANNEIRSFAKSNTTLRTVYAVANWDGTT